MDCSRQLESFEITVSATSINQHPDSQKHFLLFGSYAILDDKIGLYTNAYDN